MGYAKKNIPASYTPPCEDTRFSCAHGNQSRTTRPQAPPRKGPRKGIYLRKPAARRFFFWPLILLYTSNMLSSKNRFHGHGSLRYVYTNGETVRSRLMTLKHTTHPKRKEPRVAVVVSKKVVKSAVSRNRIRRRVYEAVRHELPSIQPSKDIVLVIFSAEVMTMPFTDLSDTIRQLFRDADIYDEQS